jgi:outer membrane biosynthesis protein TonB
MKRLLILLLLFISPVLAASLEEKFAPAIVDQAVSAVVYPKDAQCPPPKLIYAPSVVYPFEARSGAPGNVALYVRINEFGYPIRIGVAHSSLALFERNAVANAMQARWEPGPKVLRSRNAWFEYSIVFRRYD